MVAFRRSRAPCRGVAHEAADLVRVRAGSAGRAHREVETLAQAYNKTTAQVYLRWLVQQNVAVLPRSSGHAHVLENSELWSWRLPEVRFFRLRLCLT